jgi:hypothetical protein
MRAFLCALALLAATPTSAQEASAQAPSRVCVVVIDETGEDHQAEVSASLAHCRRGDVLDVYDQTSLPLTEFNALRICDQRYPVKVTARHPDPRVNAAFTCIYAGAVRPTVHAPR